MNGTSSAEADAAARVALAALGLCAATLAFEPGASLRSRCLLWPDGPMVWELLERPGEAPRSFSLSGDAAVELLHAAAAAARDVGLPWADEPVVLRPSQELLKLVRLSQLEATREESDPGS